jgi:hypothetical protein
VIATDVWHRGLGIVTTLTVATLAAVALVVPRPAPPAAAAMPAPTPETVAVQDTETQAIDCNDRGITTVVFHGTVHAIDPDMRATFHFRFADLPSRYSVMTGANGAFEVRVPRDELGYLDLCQLPSAGRRPASFQDSTLSIEYDLSFER